MILTTKGKVAVAVLVLIASYGAGVLIEHFEGETFTERIVTTDDSGYISTSLPHMIDGKLNINAASEEELLELSGIGEKLAERIVRYREEHGAFLQEEGIMLVPGIGESIYEQIKDRITVD